MKKGYVSKIILLALMVVMVATTLSACNIFEDLLSNIKPPIPTVTQVAVVHRNGLTTVAEGEYSVFIGEEFVLDIMLNDNAPENVDYKWYMTVAGEKSQIGNEKVLKYTFNAYVEGKVEFSAVAGNVESTNKIVVYVDYPSNLTNLEIKSTTHIYT